MAHRTPTPAIIAIVLALLAVLASFVAIAAYLITYWPVYVFAALLLLIAVNLSLNYRNQRRTLSMLGTNGYADIPESQPNTYTGIYRPHWEIESIQIPLAKRSVLGFPTFERWRPQFADNVPNLDDLDGTPRQFLITFVGIPSKLGRYGHMGMMDRKVFIETIVKLKRLSKAV